MVQTTQRACKVRNFSELPPEDMREQCPCCNLPIVRLMQTAPKFPLCCELKDLSEMGAGFPMYFYFVKNVLIMLILVFVSLTQAVAGIPCMVDNIRQGKSSEWDKSTDIARFTVMTSLGGYGKDMSSVAAWQGLLHSVAALVIILELICFKIFLNRRAQAMDLDVIRPSHFTVWVKNLKKNFDKEKLGEFLQNYGRKDGKFAEVYCVNVAYDIEDYVKLGLREHALMARQLYLQQFQYSVDGPPMTGCCCCRRQASLEAVEQELFTVKQEMLSREQIFMGDTTEFQTHQAFVTFMQQTDARATAKNWKRTRIGIICQWMCQCFSKQPLHFEKSYITVAPAPEPSDIMWENLSVSAVYRLYRRIVSWILTLAAIAGGFILLSFMKITQRHLKENSSQPIWVQTVFSFLLSFVIMVINKVLLVLTRQLTNQEKHQTWTNYHLSIFYKLVVLLTLNTTVMLILINSYDNFSEGRQQVRDSWFSANGLLDDVMNLMYVETLVGPLLYILSPLWFGKKLTRRRLEKRAESEVLPFTQKQLNELFESLPVDLAQRYANIAEILFMAFVFAPMCPLILPLSILSIIVNYWTDKVLLLRRHSRPRLLGMNLSDSVMLWTPVWIFTYTACNCGLSYVVSGNLEFAPACGLGAALLFWITPFKKCMRKPPITPEEMEKHILPSYYNNYLKMAPTFMDDYERSNPVTNNTGWAKWKALVDPQISQAKRKEWETYSQYQSSMTGQMADQMREYAARTSSLEPTFRTLSGQKYPYVPMQRPPLPKSSTKPAKKHL